MTVKELFIEMLKLILKGKGKYRLYAMVSGWIYGVFDPNEDDKAMGRVVLW